MLVYSKNPTLFFLRDSPALKPLTPGEVARLCRDGEGCRDRRPLAVRLLFEKSKTKTFELVGELSRRTLDLFKASFALQGRWIRATARRRWDYYR